jgi:hypothetical protein
MKLWYIYTMEYYSARRNNSMGFEGKWIQLEDTIVSKVNQDHKRCMYTKTSMIIYKLRYRTCLQQCNYSMEFGERGKGTENDRATVISHTTRYKGRGYKKVY